MKNEILSRQAAAEWLALQLQDKTVEQWALWLRNNANTARRAIHRIQVEKVGREAFYQQDELSKYVEFERQRQLGAIKLTGRAAEALNAYGTGSGGTAHGRKWKGGTAHLANDKGVVFVQAVISEPLLVFRMTGQQAIDFGTDLLEIGQAAERHNAPQKEQATDTTGYKVVTDNQDILIKRRNDK